MKFVKTAYLRQESVKHSNHLSFFYSSGCKLYSGTFFICHREYSYLPLNAKNYLLMVNNITFIKNIVVTSRYVSWVVPMLRSSETIRRHMIKF